MDCIKCGSPVPSELRDCQACGAFNGYPNVRMAEGPDEMLALEKRVANAMVSAQARGCDAKLNEFISALSASVAVISRPLNIIDNIVSSDLNVYTSHAQQLRSGARVAEENGFDQMRERFEAALFPNFREHIKFGCLSIDGTGLRGYGAYTMVLRTALIADRTTAFEENVYTFCDKMKLELTKPMPSGYRATWSNRGKLAAAKLHMELTSNTPSASFQAIVMKDQGGTANSDFIEIHVYGPISRRTIERVIARQPVRRDDKVMLKKIDRHLTSVGATLKYV